MLNKDMEQTPTLLDTKLGRDALDMAVENRIMKDFVITVAQMKNKKGEFTHNRADLQKRAQKTLKELDSLDKYGRM